MKILNIKEVIEFLTNLKLPSDVHVRRKIFSLLSELETEQKLQVIKKYEDESGDIKIYDIPISSSNVNALNKEISIYTSNPIYKDWMRYQDYLSTEYNWKSDLLNIDETTEEMFDGLTETEISFLMSLIK